MNYIEQRIQGVWVIEPVVYQDERGYFMETSRQDEFQQHTGIVFNIVQENQSKSMMGVLRGLHFQKGEYSQAKLVKVLSGAVWDVAVDLRRSSPTFGQYVIVELSEIGGLDEANGFIVELVEVEHGFARLFALFVQKGIEAALDVILNAGHGP